MSEKEATPTILKTREHFEVLDGLRGVAAIAVVTFHFMEMTIADYSKNFIGHGFLAVDFFFCLSGFVIGYAYDSRIGKMGAWEFFKSRIIRLHPLVVFGSVLGLLAFLFDPFGGNPGMYSAGTVLWTFFTSIFLIPLPIMPTRYFNLFSFNAPAWSLFWEYIANILYAFILCRIGRKSLAVIAIVSALVIFIVVNHSGNLMGGWGKDSFWDGGARICYSFSAGLLVYRFNWIIKNKMGFIWLGILLSLAFVMPFSKWNWITETIVVLFYFPLLIALGAGATVGSWVRKLCIFFGAISYPLYMTHYSVIWIFSNYFNTHKPQTPQVTFIIITGIILLTGFAYLFMVIYDVPLRKYLTARRKIR